MPPTTFPQNSSPVPAPRTVRQQSWGTIIALIIIVAMVIVGAFYAWGKRIAEERSRLQQAGFNVQTDQNL